MVANTSTCFSIGANNDGSSDGGIIALAILLAIAVIGLVISVLIIVFLVVKLKQSRYVVTSIIHCTYVAMADYLL